MKNSYFSAQRLRLKTHYREGRIKATPLIHILCCWILKRKKIISYKCNDLSQNSHCYLAHVFDWTDKPWENKVSNSGRLLVEYILMYIYNILARFSARYVVIRHANCRCPGTIQWATSSAYFLRRFTNIQDAYYTTMYGRRYHCVILIFMMVIQIII